MQNGESGIHTHQDKRGRPDIVRMFEKSQRLPGFTEPDMNARPLVWRHVSLCGYTFKLAQHTSRLSHFASAHEPIGQTGSRFRRRPEFGGSTQLNNTCPCFARLLHQCLAKLTMREREVAIPFSHAPALLHGTGEIARQVANCAHPDSNSRIQRVERSSVKDRGKRFWVPAACG